MEYKKDVERLQEKAAKYEDETTQAQFSLESIFRESKEKVFSFKLIIFYSKFFLQSRLIDELEAKYILKKPSIFNIKFSIY